MSLSVALADANVLIPRTLRDHFVYAAKAGALQIHWSQPILDEMSRNLVAKLAFDADDADDATELELRLTQYIPEHLSRYASATPNSWQGSRWMRRTATSWRQHSPRGRPSC